ncbi:unnamed protein product [Caenorhabditis sp. 36 PRJEB53466]|nr:unnamed protein product [Caenorhabditis sp. 36 PRJEB53466]
MDVLSKQAEICESNWWRNLLYVNNFAGEANSCYSITWFLAVDTQLYFLAPFLLTSLFFSLTGGVILIISGSFVIVIVVYFLFGVYDLPADFVGNGNHDAFRSVIHEVPWTRWCPFGMGIMTGYFLANFTKTRLKLHWIVPVGGWILSSALVVACLFGNYRHDSGGEWSVYQRATYFNFSQIGWTLCVCWLIIATHYGWGGPIGNFMCHPIWQPFGRLSYCAYIVHRLVLFWFYNLGGGSPKAYSAVQMFLYHSIPATVLSYFAAFFWSALFEVPIVRIEKIFIDPFLTHRKELNPSVETVRVRRGAVI